MSLSAIDFSGEYDPLDAIEALHATVPGADLQFDISGEPFIRMSDGVFVCESESRSGEYSVMSAAEYVAYQASQSTIH